MNLTERLLTLDIETSTQKQKYEEHSEKEHINFLMKFGTDFAELHESERLRGNDLSGTRLWNMLYFQKAPLNPFYGQVVSICTKATYESKPRVSYQDSGVSEKELLLAFLKDLDDLPPYNFVLTGHAIKAFDIPFLVTRMLHHGITIPKILLNANASKDWDNGKTFIDTNLPPFTSYGQRVKLVEWCMLLGIDSPKDDLSGADVPAAFWRGEYERIAKYNAKDVETEEKVALRLIEAFGMGGDR